MNSRSRAFSVFVLLYALIADPFIDLCKWIYKLSWKYPRQSNGVLFIAVAGALIWLSRDVSTFSNRDGGILFLLAALLCLRGLELLLTRRQSPRQSRREPKEV